MQDNTTDHWQWRYDMAQAMATALNMEAFGVKALYLIGSVKTGEVGPCSDIDLLAHCTSDKSKQALLLAWCEGWGLALAHQNACKTGYEAKGSLVDLHIITDEDIEQKDSFAVMLESVDNKPRLLRNQADHE